MIVRLCLTWAAFVRWSFLRPWLKIPGHFHGPDAPCFPVAPLKPGESRRPVVIFSHGLAGNRALYSEHAAEIASHVRRVLYGGCGVWGGVAWSSVCSRLVRIRTCGIFFCCTSTLKLYDDALRRDSATKGVFQVLFFHLLHLSKAHA